MTQANQSTDLKTENPLTSETVITSEARVACDGGAYAGHPRVYLDVAKTGEVICPYCSCHYVLDSKKS